MHYGSRKQKKTGSIVNISTGPAQCFVGQLAYGSSKAAIEAFTRSVAVELGPVGITVNTVPPGATQTSYLSKESIDKFIPTIPLRRIGSPKNIANAVL